MINIANDVIQNDVQTRAFHSAFYGNVTRLLSVDKDHKTIKSRKIGILTGIVYMGPANSSGYDVCPSRTKGCEKSCLYTAGFGQYDRVKVGRMRRTYQFILRQNEFMTRLAYEIEKLVLKAKYEDLIPAVRLNGTSDIDYENVPVMGHDNIFVMFPNVAFYDYTKIYNRLESCAGIANYHLTFSRAETKLSNTQAIKALDNGYSVAVVFESLPDTWHGYQVIDGDEHDFRPRDAGFVVGLTPKGSRAKHDKTGFVVR